MNGDHVPSIEDLLSELDAAVEPDESLTFDRVNGRTVGYINLKAKLYFNNRPFWVGDRHYDTIDVVTTIPHRVDAEGKRPIATTVEGNGKPLLALTDGYNSFGSAQEAQRAAIKRVLLLYRAQVYGRVQTPEAAQ